jgi:hypothetical protein
MRASKRSRNQAQSIIETVVGIIFMIPIVLFLFDVGILVLANTANDNLAKQAARAAAGATEMDASGNPTGTAAAAETAANGIVSKFATSGYIAKVKMAYFAYVLPPGSLTPSVIKDTGAGMGSVPASAQTNPGDGNVAIVMAMEARAPVPFPGFDTTRVFWARAVEPIVSVPPK